MENLRNRYIRSSSDSSYVTRIKEINIHFAILGWSIADHGITTGTRDRRTGGSLLGKNTDYCKE